MGVHDPDGLLNYYGFSPLKWFMRTIWFFSTKRELLRRLGSSSKPWVTIVLVLLWWNGSRECGGSSPVQWITLLTWFVLAMMARRQCGSSQARWFANLLWFFAITLARLCYTVYLVFLK
jgi:hypothetical protein